MPNLEILYDNTVIYRIPVDSVKMAKELVKKLSESNDQKTFVYSTVNPEKMIENTMTIKRPHYG